MIVLTMAMTRFVITKPEKTPIAIISGSEIAAPAFLLLSIDKASRAAIYEEIIKTAILTIRR